MKTKITAWVRDIINVGGGFVPKEGHRALDCTGSGTKTMQVFAALDGIIVKPTSIPIYSKMPHMDEYGFAVYDGNNDWMLYNHCLSLIGLDQKVIKGQYIGNIDSVEHQRYLRKKWGVKPGPKGDYGFTGSHCHFELIVNGGKVDSDRVHPFCFLEYSWHLGGQYETRQFNFEGYYDGYIYLKSTNEEEEKMYQEKFNALTAEFNNFKAQVATDKATMQSKIDEQQKMIQEQTSKIDALEAASSSKGEQIKELEDKNKTLTEENVKLDETVKNCHKEMEKLAGELLECQKKQPNIFNKILGWLKKIWEGFRRK